jgi:hypothetical protein
VNEYVKIYSLNREKENKMLKGFAYTTPTIGRISIGEVVDGDKGKLPQKHDYFTITTQAQSAGKWIVHPLHDALLKQQEVKNNAAGQGGGTQKLREIPIRLMFNNPDMNFRENYTAFDKGSRPICSGNGENARRVVQGMVESVGCPGAEMCEFGRANRCKPYGRLNVQIEGQDDQFSTFIFRTSGINSIRILRQKMQSMFGAFDGKLAGVPLALKIRARSSRLSFGTAFYVADLVLRDGKSIVETIAEGKQYREELKAGGFNQEWMEKEAQNSLENGKFEDSEEDMLEFEEFLLDADDKQPEASSTDNPTGKKDNKGSTKTKAGQGSAMSFEGVGLAALAQDIKSESPVTSVAVSNKQVSRIGTAIVESEVGYF